MKSITVFVNNEAVYDYDRDTTIEKEQLTFLDRMDSDMDQGFKIKGELISNPDSHQRATFVVMNLIIALQQSNNAVVSASSAYLAQRHPTLMEVHANDEGNMINIEFINED